MTAAPEIGIPGDRAQAETSQRNLLMIDTLDHVESTIRPNRVFAFPQVTVP